MSLSDDERMLLKALAAAKDPMTPGDASHVILTRWLHQGRWPWRTVRKWTKRHTELMRAWDGLKDRGLIGTTASYGMHVITDAGREALAASEVSRSGSCG